MIEINTEGKDILWSNHPKDAYTCNHKGFVMGIGAHPGISHPGIWNLVWLLTPETILDKFLVSNDVRKLAMSTNLMPFIIGTAWQQASKTSLVTLAAAKLTPLDFIEVVKSGGFYEEMLLTTDNQHWIEDCLPKALTYSGRHLDNVVQVNFGGR